MLLTKTQTLNHALKEWCVAVEALEAGKTIMLLRKGGIREESKNFEVPYRQVWLYPTYEHQKPHLLKPEYASKVTLVESGWHPDTVRIGSCAEITKVLSVSDSAKIEALEAYHIWNKQMISDRLKWKPRQPLSVLLLRVYLLPRPTIITYNKAYKGCKSWLDLVEPISPQNLTSVLSDDSYEHQSAAIEEIINF
jgi:hypothetical protein